jgi:pimeloyl-ACP methyl ester carboxylesterase/DNA-binding CsgD family transcriptional regulator
MVRPQVRYARASDGVAIAYAAIGDGPVTVVMVPPLIGQVEISWEEPAFEHFFTRLAVGARVLLFDRRGSGLSGHAIGRGELAPDQLALDVAAVLDATETARAVVLSASMGGFTAIQFAADHPERTEALILIGVTPRLVDAPGYGGGVPPESVDQWVHGAVAQWGAGGSVEAEGPSMAGIARYREWAARLERHTASPSTVEETMRAAMTWDLRAQLPRIEAPSLVIRRTDDPGVSRAHSQYIADHIAGATFLDLAGVEHTYFLGEQTPLLEAVRAFIDDRVAKGALRLAARRAERSGAYGSGWSALSPAEREIALLVGSGLTNAEIAKRLHRSPYTIDGRLRRVFQKLGVANRVELGAAVGRSTGSG